MVYERKTLRIRDTGMIKKDGSINGFKTVNNGNWINLYGSKILVTLSKNVISEKQVKHENNNFYDYFSYDDLSVHSVNNPKVTIYGDIHIGLDNNENLPNLNTIRLLYELSLSKGIVEVEGDLTEWFRITDTTTPFYMVVEKIEVRPFSMNNSPKRVSFIISGYKI